MQTCIHTYMYIVMGSNATQIEQATQSQCTQLHKRTGKTAVYKGVFKHYTRTLQV